jgi:hypothetical protein
MYISEYLFYLCTHPTTTNKILLQWRSNNHVNNNNDKNNSLFYMLTPTKETDYIVSIITQLKTERKQYIRVYVG